jgi:hypothetical protein
LCGAWDVGEEGFGCSIAVEHAVFAAFFKVEHELNGNFGAAGPIGVSRPGPMAPQISDVACQFRSSPLALLFRTQ